MNRLRTRGMTLIELVIALAIFAMLGTLSYQGIHQLINGQDTVKAELARWRDINRAVYRIDASLQQLSVAQNSSTKAQPPVVQLVENLSGRTLFFASFSPAQQARREAFVFSNGQLIWQRWQSLDPQSAMDSDVLLENVRDIRWRFATQSQRDLNLLGEWPPKQSPLPQIPPTAIELTLELPDAGPLTRLFALR